MAGRDLVTTLIRRLLTPPTRLTATDAASAASREAFVAGPLAGGRLPTVVDDTSPPHPFVRALSPIPVGPGVAGRR